MLSSYFDMQYSSAPEKDDSCYCGTVGESRGHCVKWNKPDTERPILYDLTHAWRLKNLLISQKLRNGMWYLMVVESRQRGE